MRIAGAAPRSATFPAAYLLERGLALLRYAAGNGSACASFAAFLAALRYAAALPPGWLCPQSAP